MPASVTCNGADRRYATWDDSALPSSPHPQLRPVDIPTVDVLRGLRKEGFEPFMVAQSRCRLETEVGMPISFDRMNDKAELHAADEGGEPVLDANYPPWA